MATSLASTCEISDSRIADTAECLRLSKAHLLGISGALGMAVESEQSYPVFDATCPG
jgi:hypothetical protein